MFGRVTVSRMNNVEVELRARARASCCNCTNLEAPAALEGVGAGFRLADESTGESIWAGGVVWIDASRTDGRVLDSRDQPQVYTLCTMRCARVLCVWYD